MGKRHGKELVELLNKKYGWFVDRGWWVWQLTNKPRGRIKTYWTSRTNKQAPAYKSHPDYLAAIETRQKFTPQDGADYAWAVSYAKDNYQGLEDTFRYLDEKADAIIKYVGGGTAAVTVASLLTLNKASAWLPLLFVPSIALGLLAIKFAINVRRPRTRPSPPPVWEAIKYTEAYKGQAEATFLGLWHECCEGLALVNAEKSVEVQHANRAYFAAVWLLLLPLLVWPVYVHFNSQPTPPPIKVEILNGVTTSSGGPAAAP